MAELNKIRFLIFVLLMIFPAHALDVILSSADGNFKQNSEIKSSNNYGAEKYNGTSNGLTYEARNGTTKVIVYIIDRSRFVEIMRNAVRDTRLQIAQELREWHRELVFLGIDNFDDDEHDLISEFLVDKMHSHSGSQSALGIETIGEDHFDRVYSPHRYPCHVMNIETYRENAQICGGALKARLRAIPRGALRTVGRNGKEIRLYDYHRAPKEVKWPVSVVNNTYSPKVAVNVPEYNFKVRYPEKKICLLILGGKEYLAATKYEERSPQNEEVTRILDQMTNNDEVLLILGAFNFDWTEVDIITQIIDRHTEGWHGWNLPAENVFTCGYGMFNTEYVLDVDENSGFPQQPNSNVSRLIEVLMGAEPMKRAINMIHYTDDGLTSWKAPINLCNGRYIARKVPEEYRFPWVDTKIAIIVYNLAEVNNPIDYETVDRSLKEVENSGIRLVLVEAENFGLDDMHIIAECIDYHRGVNVQDPNGSVIESERIAVLGGGIFDTIFQSESTTYRTLHNANKNELKAIRDAYVRNGNGKRVFAAQIHSPGLECWTYPMNTVNGHFEPDLIPDKDMFETTGGRKIFIIITSARRFHRISTMENLAGIEQYYPPSNWTVYLVGLDNFGERDNYLFAELVKMQTHDERSLGKFVSTFNYDVGSPVYQYRDTRPFFVDENSEIRTLITSFFAASR